MASDEFQQLSTAVTANDAAAVASLLERDPSLKARLNDPLPTESFGTVALQVAVRRANRAMIDALLDAGADINQRSHWWAGSFGVFDDADAADWLPDYLISRGARLEPTAAAKLNRLDALKAMVAANPSAVHARGGDGQTALHRARDRRDGGLPARSRRRHRRARRRSRVQAGAVSGPRSAGRGAVSRLARLLHRHPARRGARRHGRRRAPSRREPACCPHERGRDVVPDEKPSCRRHHLHLDARRQENGAHYRPGVRTRRCRAAALEGQRRLVESDDGVRARRRRPRALADRRASRAGAGASTG